MNECKPKYEGVCDHCGSYGTGNMVQPLEGIDGALECVNVEACELRITSKTDLRGVAISECKACRRPVYLGNTDHGTRLAIEPEPHPTGLYVVECVDKGELYITRFKSKNRPKGRALYRLHHPECVGRSV